MNGQLWRFNCTRKWDDLNCLRSNSPGTVSTPWHCLLKMLKCFSFSVWNTCICSFTCTGSLPLTADCGAISELLMGCLSWSLHWINQQLHTWWNKRLFKVRGEWCWSGAPDDPWLSAAWPERESLYSYTCEHSTVSNPAVMVWSDIKFDTCPE